MNASITIPAAAGSASYGPIAIPDGIRAARLEVILSDADFNAGKVVEVSVRIQGDGIDQTSSATCQSGPLGDGNPLYIQLSNPMAIVDGVCQIVAFPSGFVATFTLQVTNDAACQVGGIVSFADAVENLPATQRPIVT
jgi:hypothetical protein